MLIVGGYVTNHGNDKKELEKVVDSVEAETYKVEKVIADNGYYSEAEVWTVEKEDEEGNRQGPKVYCAVGKQPHHRTVGDLEKREQAPAPGKGAPVKEVMGPTG
jgi:hypothetical protein